MDAAGYIASTDLQSNESHLHHCEAAVGKLTSGDWSGFGLMYLNIAHG